MTDDVAGPGNGPLPIREVPLTAPLRWLALGWHDFTRAFGPSLFHGFIVMAAGMAISSSSGLLSRRMCGRSSVVPSTRMPWSRRFFFRGSSSTTPIGV